MRKIFTIIVVILAFSPNVSIGQEVKELFRSDEILKLDILLPLKDVTRDLREKEEHPATLYYTDADGQNKEFNIKITTRGKTRKKVCHFPPLEINFKKKEVKHSVFNGQNKIKLVTHCKGAESFESYIKKEYLVYKLYQQITPNSFQVRLCEINYKDLKNPDESNVHIGFLIEQIKDVASRNEMEVFKESIINQQVLEKDELDKLVMFQFMIGNLDWSIPNRHNIKLIKSAGKGLPVAVPYDFDYSGMVDAPYAVPPEGINIETVKERKFRGLCKANGYAGTVNFYQKIKNQVLEEVTDATFLSPRSKGEMTEYLNSFYDLISDPKEVKEKIDRACRAKHKHIYEY